MAHTWATLSWGCHEDWQHPQPPLTVSPLLPSSRVVSSSIQLQAVLTQSSFCSDSTCVFVRVCERASVRAWVSLRANFPLSHRHVKAYPPCLSPLTSRPVSVNTQLAKNSSASAADSLFLWLLYPLRPSPLLSPLWAHNWFPVKSLVCHLSWVSPRTYS